VVEITITQVENGFILRRDNVVDERVLVFHDLGQLISYLLRVFYEDDSYWKDGYQVVSFSRKDGVWRQD